MCARVQLPDCCVRTGGVLTRLSGHLSGTKTILAVGGEKNGELHGTQAVMWLAESATGSGGQWHSHGHFEITEETDPLYIGISPGSKGSGQCSHIFRRVFCKLQF